MSQIDFQNGFVVGMATKGLIRSGELYSPRIWNDEGVYSSFYIDFRRNLSVFSLGMFNESIIVYDSEAIEITAVEFVSTGIYRIYGSLLGKIQGVTVVNKKSTLLTTTNGVMLPVFSTMFFVAGLDTYIRRAYAYDITNVGDAQAELGLTSTDSIVVENVGYHIEDLDTHEIADIDARHTAELTPVENITISYWTT